MNSLHFHILDKLTNWLSLSSGIKLTLYPVQARCLTASRKKRRGTTTKSFDFWLFDDWWVARSHWCLLYRCLPLASYSRHVWGPRSCHIKLTVGGDWSQGGRNGKEDWRWLLYTLIAASTPLRRKNGRMREVQNVLKNAWVLFLSILVFVFFCRMTVPKKHVGSK